MREGRGKVGRGWKGRKGGEGVPECPNPELASLISGRDENEEKARAFSSFSSRPAFMGVELILEWG